MTDAMSRIGGTIPAVPTTATSNAGATAASESPAFRALLESIERLAKKPNTAEEVSDPSSLARAVADADDGFRQAMDLRRRLEDAFRAQHP